MPLIDLKTNLKSIKYGSDQPGGGYSGLPYIKTALPDVLNGAGTSSPIFRIGSTGNLDYPIRGGNLNFNIGTQTFTLSSQVDKSRIKKFFEDAPRGTAFIQKQIGLQLSNPKIETGNTLYGLGQGDPLPGLLENTRVYNRGTNTLTQVGVSGTGAHAIRHGLMPFNPWQKNYYDIVNKQNVNQDLSTNRLLILNQLKMSSGTSQFVNTQNIPNIELVNNLGISTNRNLIFQYWGGPGSVYGVGTTTIKRAVDTTRLSGTNGMSYDQIMSMNNNKDKYTNNLFGRTIPTIQDFRNQITTNQPYTPWGNNEVDKRFYVSAGSYKDKMNLLYPFAFKNDTAPWEINADKTDDLVKFVFEAISNDDPNYSTAIFFRAFLTAGITDNNSATLNSFKYMGRGEDFFTYQGFSRTISFAFRVAAGSRDELRPLYNKVNTLVSQVYPDYSPTQGIMRASVVRITLGDYIYRVPGFLESVNITVDNNTPWEVNLEKSQTGDIAQLPQVLDIAVSFRPIMDVLPRRSSLRVYSAEEVTDTFATETQNPALIANGGTIIKNDPLSLDLTTRNRLAEIRQNIESQAPQNLRTNQFRSNFERQFNLNLNR